MNQAIDQLMSNPPAVPVIEPEPLPAPHPAESFTMNVHLGHLAVVDGADEMTWVTLGHREGRVTKVVQIRRGPDTMVNGRACLRHDRDLYLPEGYVDQPRESITLFHQATERELIERLVSVECWAHDQAKPRRVRHILSARVVMPRRIRLGERFTVDHFAYGEIDSTRPPTRYEADGLFRLRQNGQSHTALRLRVRCEEAHARTVDDYYLDTTSGLLLHRRSYENAGGSLNDALDGQPQIDIDGESFRLRSQDVVLM